MDSRLRGNDKTMKIGIYSPYLDTVGGGEKYILTIAEVLSREHQVDVLLDKNLFDIGIESIKKRVDKIFSLDLSKVNFIITPLGRGSNILDKYFFLKRYDYFFYNTDGSMFYSTARNNIVHFQVPFENTSTKGLKGKLKLSSWKMAIYNSRFTKDIVEETWPIKGIVVYPPVSVESIKPLKKRQYILSVGRFAAHTKSKKHEVLIEAFKKLSDNKNAKGWSLHLAGGVLKGHEEYFSALIESAKGYNIKFYDNVSYSELVNLYGSSSIYWHAAGYGETDPKNFEHFGITTVEAMAGGSVPVVINLGGQKEIVDQNESGFLWNTIAELIDYTTELVEDKNLRSKLSKNAISKSKNFSKDRFEDHILNLIK